MKNKLLMSLMSLISLLSLMGLTGCSGLRPARANTHEGIDIAGLSRMLHDSLRVPSLKNREIGVLTFADLDHLEEVSPLGRLLREKLAHALFGLGFRISELRMGSDIYFDPGRGELNLTRLDEKLKQNQFKGLRGLVVGTYMDAGDYVYVNAWLIELENNLVRASGEIKIPRGEYLERLLNAGVYERFPAGDRDR